MQLKPVLQCSVLWSGGCGFSRHTILKGRTTVKKSSPLPNCPIWEGGPLLCMKICWNHLHNQLGLSNNFHSNMECSTLYCPCWIENDGIEVVITYVCLYVFPCYGPTYTYIVVLHVPTHVVIGKFNMGGRGLTSYYIPCRLAVSDFHVALSHYHTCYIHALAPELVTSWLNNYYAYWYHSIIPLPPP